MPCRHFWDQQIGHRSQTAPSIPGGLLAAGFGPAVTRQGAPLSPGSGVTQISPLCVQDRGQPGAQCMEPVGDNCYHWVTALGLQSKQQAVVGCRRGGSSRVGTSSSTPQTLQGSALKERQGRISTGKNKLSLPRADEKRCYKVTCLW